MCSALINCVLVVRDYARTLGSYSVNQFTSLAFHLLSGLCSLASSSVVKRLAYNIFLTGSPFVPNHSGSNGVSVFSRTKKRAFFLHRSPPDLTGRVLVQHHLFLILCLFERKKKCRTTNFGVVSCSIMISSWFSCFFSHLLSAAYALSFFSPLLQKSS